MLLIYLKRYTHTAKKGIYKGLKFNVYICFGGGNEIYIIWTYYIGYILSIVLLFIFQAHKQHINSNLNSKDAQVESAFS